MRTQITNSHCSNIFSLAERIKGIKYYKAKRSEFALAVDSLPPEEMWLLSFCVWHCLFNSRLKPIDSTRLHGTPVKDFNKTFLDFVDVLRQYDRVTIHRRMDGELARFLAGAGDLRAFYMSLLDKTFIDGLPMMEAQTLLDVDDITSTEIYRVTELDVQLDELTYPLTMRRIASDTGLTEGTVAKGVSGIMCRNVNKAIVARDMKFSAYPLFALYGFVSNNKFHPVAYFNSWPDYRNYRRSTDVATGDYIKGMSINLNKYLSDNLITRMDDSLVEYVEDPATLRESLIKLVPTVGPKYLLITDKNTPKTGIAKTVKVRIAYGIAERFWVEEGKVLGVKAWLNGVLHNVPHELSSKESSILFAPEEICGQEYSMYYLSIGGTTSLIGKEIRWDTKTWRNYRLRGSSAYIEKCCFCGNALRIPKARGMCKTCENNIPVYFAEGVDTWITPRAHILKSREESCWEPSLLNRCEPMCRGYVVVSNDDGKFMFKSDETVYRNYIERISNL